MSLLVKLFVCAVFVYLSDDVFGTHKEKLEHAFANCIRKESRNGSIEDECFQLLPDTKCLDTECEAADVGASKGKRPHLCGFSQYDDAVISCSGTTSPVPSEKLCTKVDSGECFKNCEAWNRKASNMTFGCTTRAYLYSDSVAYNCTVTTKKTNATKIICGCSQVGKPTDLEEKCKPA